MSELANDPVPPAIRDILALFGGELRDQRFGDLDHEALERLADETRARAREVEQQRAALEAALASLDVAREALTTRARQGLAYAAVYGASDPALAEKLAALEAEHEAPRDKRAAPKRKRAGKRVTAGAATGEASELPFEAESAA